MSLLDFLNTDDGRLGLGLLAASGPAAQPMGFGERIQQAMQGQDAYKQNALRNSMFKQQMEVGQMGLDQARIANARDLDISGMASSAAGDTNAFLAAVRAKYPLQGMDLEHKYAKDNSPLVLAPGATALDRRTLKPIYSAPDKESVPADIKGYEYAKEQGYPGTYEQWLIAKQRAGAPAAAKIDIKMGESVAGQVGPMLKESYGAANGAVGTVDASNRIIDAVESGNLIAGPLANGRLKVAQVASILGVGGKDDAEKIANTRQAIRALSEMTLQGRKQMTGQGAITESESKLAEKANSGDLSDLTPAELKQLAHASARAARFIYEQHGQMVQNVSSDPSTAGLAKFYKPLPMPAMRTSPIVKKSPANVPAGGVKFLGFE